MHGEFEQYFYWRIVVPCTDWTIWEGMADQTAVSLYSLTAVWWAVTIFAIALKRFVDHRAREKSQ